MENLMASLLNMPVKKRLLLGLSVGLLVLTAGVFARVALAPSYGLLYAELESGQSGHVLEALEQRGFLYKVRNGSILVEQKHRDELRMTLASIGLPKASVQGYELLDNLSGFSTTSQMFDAAYWRAKEGELARTIASSPHIHSARVHISNPSIKFFRQTLDTKASISIRTTNGGINIKQAQALKYLVSSAVSGMAVSDVAVIDEDFGLIADSAAENTTPAADEKAAELKSKVEHLLTAHLGYGNAIAEVSLETFQNTESIIEKTFDPKSRVAISVNSVESETTSATSDDQMVSVASNLPDKSSSAPSGSKSATTETRETTNFEVSETERKLTISPNRVERLTIAVLVNSQAISSSDQDQTAAILSDIRDLVKAAVGFQSDRGDVIIVKALDFIPDSLDPDGYETSSNYLQNIDITALLKVLVLAVIAAILGLKVIRPIIAGGPKWVNSNPMPIPVTGSNPQQIALGQPKVAGQDQVTDLVSVGPENLHPSGAHDTVHRLRDMIGDKQEETVEILRNWLEEGRKTP